MLTFSVSAVQRFYDIAVVLTFSEPVVQHLLRNG